LVIDEPAWPPAWVGYVAVVVASERNKSDESKPPLHILQAEARFEQIVDGSTAQPVATLVPEPDELHARLAIAFQETHDQLDYLKLGVLDLASGRRIALIRHTRSPGAGYRRPCAAVPQQFTSATDLPGVMAAIDRHQDALITETLSALGIDAQAVSWRRPIGVWLRQHHAEASAESPPTG